MPAFPPLAEIHDDLFWCLQFTGERMALLRSIINETGETPLLKLRLQEEAARADRLADFAVGLYRLIPREAQFRDLVGQLADKGYFRTVETA